MSKELTPLEHLEFIRNYEIDDEHRTLNMNYASKQSLDIIETALKRLEKIETTTHSVLREDVSKKLKALEIIKEHGVDVAEIMICQDYVQYEARFCGNVKGRVKLNEEEFDLLKEVLL